MAQPQLQDILQALGGARTQSGHLLSALSETSPVLLVFLRHAGCTFCREAIGDVARDRGAIERSGVRIVLVLDEERIVDPHAVAAYDHKRGVRWELDLLDLG